MKRTLITLALAGLLAAPSTKAVTVSLTAGILLNELGNPLADGNTVLVVASTTNLGFGNLESANLASATSFLNEADDVILAQFDMNSISVGVPGAFNEVFSYTLGVNGVTAGDPFMLVWYSGLAEAGNPSAPGYDRHFGTYRAADWVVPGDNSLTYDVNMLTADAGGELANNEGLANQITEAAVIPEPATGLLVAMSALSLVGLFRRRK